MKLTAYFDSDVLYALCTTLSSDLINKTSCSIKEAMLKACGRRALQGAQPQMTVVRCRRATAARQVTSGRLHQCVPSHMHAEHRQHKHWPWVQHHASGPTFLILIPYDAIRRDLFTKVREQ